jgi:hypothetical protein
LSFSAYRPEDASCAIYGTSQLIQFNTETCSSVVSTLGSGLAVSPITDSKGNVYIGISNLKPGTAVTSGRDNIYKATTPGVNQKIKIKSWLERRN